MGSNSALTHPSLVPHIGYTSERHMMELWTHKHRVLHVAILALTSTPFIAIEQNRIHAMMVEFIIVTGCSEDLVEILVLECGNYAIFFADYIVFQLSSPHKKIYVEKLWIVSFAFYANLF
jgi:hypothetical protein